MEEIGRMVLFVVGWDWGKKQDYQTDKFTGKVLEIGGMELFVAG